MDWIPVAALVVSLVAASTAVYSVIQTRKARVAAELTARINETIELRRRFAMEVTHVRGNAWRLRNVGTVGALNVTVGAGDGNRGPGPAFLVNEDEVDISPGSSRLFRQVHTFAGGGMHVHVRWMPDLAQDDPDRKVQDFVEATPPLE